MTWQVAPLRARRRREAASVLTEALLADPAWTLVVPDEAERRPALRAVVSAALADSGPHVRAVEHDAAVVGVAVWQPPGRYPMGTWRQLRAARHLVPLVRSRAAAGPVRRLGDSLDSLFPATPVRYLQALGVAPAHQGSGIGGALLADGLQQARGEQVDVYLETGDASNVGYYERHGFVLLEPGRPVHDAGPVMWRMRRPVG